MGSYISQETLESIEKTLCKNRSSFIIIFVTILVNLSIFIYLFKKI